MKDRHRLRVDRIFPYHRAIPEVSGSLLLSEATVENCTLEMKKVASEVFSAEKGEIVVDILNKEGIQ